MVLVACWVTWKDLVQAKQHKTSKVFGENSRVLYAESK